MLTIMKRYKLAYKIKNQKIYYQTKYINIYKVF